MIETRQSTFLEFDAHAKSFQDELSRRSVQAEQVRNTPPSRGIGRYSGRLMVQPSYGQIRATQA